MEEEEEWLVEASRPEGMYAVRFIITK